MVAAIGLEIAVVFGRYMGAAFAVDFASRFQTCLAGVLLRGWAERCLCGSGAGV